MVTETIQIDSLKRSYGIDLKIYFEINSNMQANNYKSIRKISYGKKLYYKIFFYPHRRGYIVDRSDFKPENVEHGTIDITLL